MVSAENGRESSRDEWKRFAPVKCGGGGEGKERRPVIGSQFGYGCTRPRCGAVEVKSSTV